MIAGAGAGESRAVHGERRRPVPGVSHPPGGGVLEREPGSLDSGLEIEARTG
jgi:hypothetical protein